MGAELVDFWGGVLHFAGFCMLLVVPARPVLGEGGTLLYPTWFICSGGPRGGSPSPPKSWCDLSPPFTHCDLPHCRETPKNEGRNKPAHPSTRRCWHTPRDPLPAKPAMPPCPSSDGGGHPCGAPGSPQGGTKPAVPAPSGPKPRFSAKVGTLGTAWAQWVPPAASPGVPTLTQDISHPSHWWGTLLFISKQ